VGVYFSCGMQDGQAPEDLRSLRFCPAWHCW
jgi:hypothetical protein